MAIETVRNLLMAVERADEAQPMMPFATISVTEDMATAFRLHATGWRSAYHDEVLAKGLAPEDLRTALQQRLRWAQGTIQVALRENPLAVRGLSLGQRLMYFATIWSYLAGFFAVIYMAAPVAYLLFGWLPVNAYSSAFFWRLIPFLIANQLLFTLVGWGRPTWRGQQYSLALFPLWIKAVTSAAGNVWFGRKLGFVVTPKTRQSGRYYGLVKPQIVAIALMASAMLYGVVGLALGARDDWFPVMVNLAWGGFILAMLSVVVVAANYQPEDAATEPEPNVAIGTAAEAHGRALGGSR
jgi:cellulose synthase (UDP-forming)